TYYLISTEASSTNGTIGWVKSSQINIHDHTGVDKETKVFTVKGEGQAYTKAWGGSKDRVYNLSNYKDQVFIVNKTERVGNNIWYRGKLNGEQVFIHESFVSEVKQTNTSKLGHLKSNAEIYKQLGDLNSKIDNTKYLNAVYYIKSQSTINGQEYYLISTQASSTDGTIGWVESSQINTHNHTGVDTESKTFFIDGKGQAYSKAWGGNKDFVYNLSNYKEQPFQINKTEKVGNNIWYRGVLNGRQVFIHESYLTEDRMVYENFNVTLNSALNTQMNQLQQTDKYRNSPAFIHQNYVNASNITTANVNVRAAANTSSHIYGILDRGSVVSILGSQNSFYQINYEAWRNPTRQDVLQYLNPSNNDIFQHLSLSDSVGVKASSINNLLMGKGILSGKGQAFIDGANQHQINEVYLISHALLETGNGGSALAQGVEVGTNGSGNPILVTSSNRSSLKNIQTVYNMFGIGAIDGDAHRAGAVHAYREGWNTPEKAITGGAKFIGDRYIHNSDNQDTLYKMRWNPANPGYHQYATDIGWAVKQVSTIKTMYEQLDNPVLRFKVPNYK
ncbi:N-acetylglucosaminidase, partial [Oceanobacillus neutriphilus]|uniref:N-acetylglucosaminidase n=1 Tax=Oceanobacillus neutriphilus TaxID=531815 RepID=UPI001669F0C4